MNTKLIDLINQRDKDIKMLKHKINNDINIFLESINGKKIKKDNMWISVLISLSLNNITITIMEEKEEKVKLHAAIKISEIIENKFTLKNVGFIQENDTRIMVDPKKWILMKELLIKYIEEMIGFSSIWDVFYKRFF